MDDKVFATILQGAEEGLVFLKGDGPARIVKPKAAEEPKRPVDGRDADKPVKPTGS